FQNYLTNKLDEAKLKEFQARNGWKSAKTVTSNEICKNARKGKNWIHSIELGNENNFDCCSYHFYGHCVSNDGGGSEALTMEKYYLLHTNFFICGYCVYNIDLDMLADYIRDNFDEFKNKYMIK
ncbi:MAG: hypothetical protein Homavirus20_11, partial [Homavirus sp.]